MLIIGAVDLQFHRPLGRHLRLRRNQAETLPSPQWQRGLPSNPENVCAAYELDAPTEALRVSLTVDGLYTPGEYRFRAVAREDTKALFGDILLPAGSVTLSGTTPEVISLRLERGIPPERGVGIVDVAWHWQYQTLSETGWTDWIDLEETRHRVYVLLSVPWYGPWEIFPDVPEDSVHLVWTDVLDVACTWAAGCVNEEEVAAAITKRLFQLGQTLDADGERVLQYTGTPHYTENVYYDAEQDVQHSDVFFCDAFLAQLNGKEGAAGPFVNCQDCASGVVALATAVGTPLRTVRLHSFGTRPFASIGSPIGEWSAISSWSFHEFGWLGRINPDGLVFDACLSLEGETDPVLGLKAGDAAVPAASGQEDTYAARLIDPASSVQFERYGIRRVAYPKSCYGGGPAAPWPDAADRFGFDEWRDDVPDGNRMLVWRYPLSPEDLPGWTRTRIGTLTARPWARTIETTWRPSNDPGSQSVSITLLECASRRSAATTLLHWLSSSEQGDTLSRVDPGFGEVTFTDADLRRALFIRGNLAIRLDSRSDAGNGVGAIGTLLDSRLSSRPDTGTVIDLGTGAIPIEGLGVTAARDRDAILFRAGIGGGGLGAGWYKFFSEGAALRIQGGVPTVQPRHGRVELINIIRVAAGTPEFGTSILADRQ